MVVVFPDHTHLLFLVVAWLYKKSTIELKWLELIYLNKYLFNYKHSLVKYLDSVLVSILVKTL